LLLTKTLLIVGQGASTGRKEDPPPARSTAPDLESPAGRAALQRKTNCWRVRPMRGVERLQGGQVAGI
jgi:hypothetical protein